MPAVTMANGHWEPLFMPGVILNALDSFYHIGPQNNPSESMVIIIPILYMRKLKLRELRQFIQSHKVG